MVQQDEPFFSPTTTAVWVEEVVSVVLPSVAAAAGASFAEPLLFDEEPIPEDGAAALAEAAGALLETVAGVIILVLKSGLPYVLKTIYRSDKNAQLEVR